MLDVMRRPPSVIVQVEWVATRVRVPDTDRMVMIYTPEDEAAPVWMGWWSAKEEGFFVSGARSWIGSVTWWAEMPVAPAEPKP